ncbi:glycosyltransferase [Xanthobacteraceae bacterium Astr-EGSB]|uniref:CgeB family protein n=1 Tax=Astrobacterium formosum TaxID=3069710 RepID=UPI0027B2CAE3|nr:glycosyltransferase [Xanthobacteraceae bacterium Astr-EGSB]
MKVVIFCHSILSCWNHGNAHFLRGIARELIRRGHEVEVQEPRDGWSRINALRDSGAASLVEAGTLVRGLGVTSYASETPDLDRALDGADLVLVHEWTAPSLVAAVGRRRQRGGRFNLFFHDTHHRAVTAPSEMDALDLDGYDGILAFGEVLRQVYQRRGWGGRAFTWHEAADTALFRPLPPADKDVDLLWIGNWGDEERSRELDEFLIEPITRLRLRARIHGVRYPAEIRVRLASLGIEFGGWLPNHHAPAAYARARFTVHVPRRPYVEQLPGIPTIRVFEALACGMPLVCSPWSDVEGLFPKDAYRTARDGREMEIALSALLRDPDLAAETAALGRAAILARHTCAHRVDELLAIIEKVDTAPRRRGVMLDRQQMDMA